MQNSQKNLEQSLKETQVFENYESNEPEFVQIQLQKPQGEEKETFENSNQDYSLENEFLKAIEQIKSQTDQIHGPINEEVIFLLGNTGSGKSTLFNWLMGKNLVVQKDPNQRAKKWIVEVESDVEIQQSKIGHIQVSTTTIPKIAKSPHGPYLVDFPGWQDTRGWQYDFVNQLVASDITYHCNKIKILFICDYNVFETDRRIGIKQLVNNINSFAQGNSINCSAMLVITKLMLQDDEHDDYIHDIRRSFQGIITKDKLELMDESKSIISSLILNDIFIMEKALPSQQRQFSDERRLILWKMIDKLESSSIQLQVYVSNEINLEFTRYFNNEMIKIKDRVKQIIEKIWDISVKLVEQKRNEMIELMHRTIKQAKNDLLQNTWNQIIKYEMLEKLYYSIIDIISENRLDDSKINRNFVIIYNHFFSIKEKIQAYQIQFISDVDFHNIFIIEQNLSVELKIMKIMTQQQIDQERKEFEKLQQQYQEQKRKLEEKQQEEKRQYNRMRRNIENDKRHIWWIFWRKPRIPDWVEDVDEYIKMGG